MESESVLKSLRVNKSGLWKCIRVWVNASKWTFKNINKVFSRNFKLKIKNCLCNTAIQQKFTKKQIQSLIFSKVTSQTGKFLFSRLMHFTMASTKDKRVDIFLPSLPTLIIQNGKRKQETQTTWFTSSLVNFYACT